MGGGAGGALCTGVGAVAAARGAGARERAANTSPRSLPRVSRSGSAKRPRDAGASRNCDAIGARASGAGDGAGGTKLAATATAPAMISHASSLFLRTTQPYYRRDEGCNLRFI
jgi:hypothetical protein